MQVFIGDGLSAAAVVAPIAIDARRLQVEQVPAIFDMLELAAQPGVHVAEPKLIVRAMHVPFPLPLPTPLPETTSQIAMAIE